MIPFQVPERACLPRADPEARPPVLPRPGKRHHQRQPLRGPDLQQRHRILVHLPLNQLAQVERCRLQHLQALLHLRCNGLLEMERLTLLEALLGHGVEEGGKRVGKLTGRTVADPEPTGP